MEEKRLSLTFGSICERGRRVQGSRWKEGEHGYPLWMVSALCAAGTEHRRTKAGSRVPQPSPMPDAHRKGQPVPHDPWHHMMVGPADPREIAQGQWVLLQPHN